MKKNKTDGGGRGGQCMQADTAGRIPSSEMDTSVNAKDSWDVHDHAVHHARVWGGTKTTTQHSPQQQCTRTDTVTLHLNMLRRPNVQTEHQHSSFSHAQLMLGVMLLCKAGQSHHRSCFLSLVTPLLQRSHPL